MKQFIPRSIPAIPLLLVAAMLVWLLLPVGWVTDSVTSATLLDQNRNPKATARPVHLPFSAQSLYAYQKVPDDELPTYVFTLGIESSWSRHGAFQFIPDDCISRIRVNGTDLEVLKKNTDLALCDLSKGFRIDLSSYLHPGKNQVEVTVEDTRGGNYALAVNPVLFADEANYKVINVFLALGLAWALLLHALRFDAAVTAGSLVSLLAALMAFYHTTYDIRTPDWWGHVPYIQYIGRNWTVPKPQAGWEYYHPPLYYYLAAIFGKCTRWLWHTNFIYAARHFSIFCTLAFELFGLLFIRRAVQTPWIARLCSLALLAWPFHIMSFGRIGNETLLYPLWAASYYCLLRWYQKRNVRSLAAAIALGAAMILTKTSGIVPLFTIGLVVLHELVKKRASFRSLISRSTVAAGVLVMLACAGNFGRLLYYKLSDAPQMGLVVSNMYMDKRLSMVTVPNTLHDFVSFNLLSYLTEPWFNIFAQNSDRTLFWNAYLKSSMFSFFSLEWGNPVLSLYLNGVLLLLVVFVLGATLLLWQRAKDDAPACFLFICIASSIGLQIAGRLVTSSVCLNDARITFPVIIAFLSLFGVLTQRLGQVYHPKVALAGGMLLGIFSCTAYLYIVLLAVSYA